MEEVVEKSCWNITLWAVAAAIALVVVGSFVTGSQNASNAEIETTAAVHKSSE